MYRINLLIPPWVGNNPGKEMSIYALLLMNDKYKGIMPYNRVKSKFYFKLQENAIFRFFSFFQFKNDQSTRIIPVDTFIFN